MTHSSNIFLLHSADQDWIFEQHFTSQQKAVFFRDTTAVHCSLMLCMHRFLCNQEHRVVRTVSSQIKTSISHWNCY